MIFFNRDHHWTEERVENTRQQLEEMLGVKVYASGIGVLLAVATRNQQARRLQMFGPHPTEKQMGEWNRTVTNWRLETENSYFAFETDNFAAAKKTSALLTKILGRTEADKMIFLGSLDLDSDINDVGRLERKAVIIPRHPYRYPKKCKAFVEKILKHTLEIREAIHYLDPQQSAITEAALGSESQERMLFELAGIFGVYVAKGLNREGHRLLFQTAGKEAAICVSAHINRLMERDIAFPANGGSVGIAAMELNSFLIETLSPFAEELSAQCNIRDADSPPARRHKRDRSPRSSGRS